MYVLYNVLGFLYLLVAGPAYLLKVYRNKDYRKDFGSRFGFFAPDLSERLGGRRWIWVHAVSVGEVIAARPVLRELRKMFPQEKILLSTVTPTGQQVARETKEADLTVFLPVDVAWWAVHRLVAMVNPKALVILETEIWPNLIRAVAARRVPIAMINGRISDRSFKRYHAVRTLLRDLLSRIDFFGMQTEDDARRIVAIGAPKERVHVTGSCKFDTLMSSSTQNLEALREIIVPRGNRKVLVGGSTHPGEEEMLLRVFEQARRRVENLLLVIAPRHIDRAPGIEAMVKQSGLRVALRSELTVDRPGSDCDVVILNTIGELANLYHFADVVVIGKSFVGQGGQNPLEPAAVGKPVLFGPNMQNFREVSRLLLENGGAIQVADEATLTERAISLLCGKQDAAVIGKRGQEVIRKHSGASKRSAEAIASLIRSTDS